jgi:hypothetical protein
MPRSAGHLTVSMDEETDDMLGSPGFSDSVENTILTGVVAKTHEALRPVVSTL